MSSTNPKRDLGNTEGSLCDGIQLKTCRRLARFYIGELTSENAAPY
jgi:hypothetical protein